MLSLITSNFGKRDADEDAGADAENGALDSPAAGRADGEFDSDDEDEEDSGGNSRVETGGETMLSCNSSGPSEEDDRSKEDEEDEEDKENEDDDGADKSSETSPSSPPTRDLVTARGCGCGVTNKAS